MDHDTLTARYLDEIARHEVTAADTIGALRRQPLLDTLRRGRYLPRPVFLGQRERDQLHADVENVRTALFSLPDRLFGGDLAAFAKAAGATQRQLDAALRSRRVLTLPLGPANGLARADLY